MPRFGAEYSSDSVFFIAGGRTLEIIKKFEDDGKNWVLDSQIFAKRLTGAEKVPLNPDQIQEPGTYNTHFVNGRDNGNAASYRKYGDVYVVEVPLTIRGIFNAASEKESQEFQYRINVAAGYKYEWFTPPDSQLIPLSKVIELREKELGDQTKPRQVMVMTASRLPHPRNHP
jgi:hypothetical protein